MGDESLENKDKKKRALVIIPGPYTLFQFIWYYCTYGKEYTWTCAVHSYGANDDRSRIVEFCTRLNVFDQFVYCKKSYLFSDFRSKVILFLKMLFHYVIGRREYMCEMIIRENIGDSDYDLYLVPGDNQLLSGALISYADRKNVVVLEEGLGDYVERSGGKLPKRFTISEISSFLLAKMEYSNPTNYYPLKMTKYCEKFYSVPELASYLDYKKISKLFETECTDMTPYRELLKRTYFPEGLTQIGSGDVLLITTPPSDFGDEARLFRSELEKYLDKRYYGKTIIVKKHPRDDECYESKNNTLFQDLDKDIPTEALKFLLAGKEVIMAFPSTVLLFFENCQCDYSVLYFKKVAEKNALYKDGFNEHKNLMEKINLSVIEC